MSAALDTPIPTRHDASDHAGLRDAATVNTLRVTFPRVVRSEWYKFASLRSSWITLAVAVVVLIGFGVLAALVTTGDVTPSGPNGQPGPGPGGFSTDPTSLSLSGAMLAQIVLGILGVLLVSGEYSSGMIRATLAAVPHRLPVLWAKALVIGVVSLLVSAAAALAAFLAAQQILGDGANASLTDHGVLRAVLGSGGYLAGVALLGVALGALLRHAAGAIGALFGLLLLAPALLGAILPSSWKDAVVPYLPSNAASSFTSVVPPHGMLSATAGAAVLAGWVVILLAAAAVLLRRRDA
ncbi:ABC-type transport system involved in multi-copper enzyme maturation permease subunit [Kribbella aluminosa]|uniref:ABC-type transport system involved in multi-copper enzyme maturation permease subunit n=1 Tax=Kribbella aluminosa TaxID=416017 RepID=A0ABS4UJ39_9ACTN|nr:ABC transporter permease subunit [Kribbella aluminosa]MBP2351653.1 ABC-type transport system involved in multi-copper enzyme maturation permease subunit [Kribbella aluminosa]